MLLINLTFCREDEIKDIKVEEKKTKLSQLFSHRELKLHELRAETYNGLVRLIKPGCRTIILLIDNSTAVLLAQQFYQVMWPYRKYDYTLFIVLSNKSYFFFLQILIY